MRRSFIWDTFVFLIILDLALVFGHLFFRDALGFFDLDKEGSAKAVFSGMQLIASGICAGAVALLTSRLTASRKALGVWPLLSTLFFLLAFDDMMMIHERIGFVLNRWTGWHGDYESFNWLVYFFPLMLAGGAILAICVRALFRLGRREGIFALCGLAGFLGTLAMEYVGGELLKQGSISWYHPAIILEESLLLIGESFFLVALLSAAALLFGRGYIRRDSSVGAHSINV